MAERLIGLLLLPVLTRKLTNVEYGVWSQTAVASSVLMPLVLFCLPTAIVKFFAAGIGEVQRRLWMRRMLALAGGLLCALGLLAWAGQAVISVLVYGGVAEQGFVVVLVVILAADALFDLLLAFLRADFRMRWIAALLVSRGGLRFGFMLGALTLFDLPFLHVFGMLALLQLILVAIAFALELRRPVVTGASKGAVVVSWHTMLAFAAPLVALAVLTSINAFADRFVLTQLLGLEAVAVYAATSSVVGIAGVAYTVLGFALFPVLARQWALGDIRAAAEVARDAMLVFLFIALPFALWLAALSGAIFPLLMTPEYRVPAQVVLLLGIGVVGFGLYQIVLYLLLLAGKGANAVWFMLVAALLNTVCNVFLVPRLGWTGAALSAALSNMVLAAVAFRSAQQHAQARFPWAGAMRIALAACLAAGVGAFADKWLAPPGWAGVLLCLGLAGAAYLAADLLAAGSVIRAFDWRRSALSSGRA